MSKKTDASICHTAERPKIFRVTIPSVTMKAAATMHKAATLPLNKLNLSIMTLNARNGLFILYRNFPFCHEDHEEMRLQSFSVFMILPLNRSLFFHVITVAPEAFASLSTIFVYHTLSLFPPLLLIPFHHTIPIPSLPDRASRLLL